MDEFRKSGNQDTPEDEALWQDLQDTFENSLGISIEEFVDMTEPKEGEVSVMEPAKSAAFYHCVDEINRVFADLGVKISHKMNGGIWGSADITVRGPLLYVHETDALSGVCKLADSFELNAYTDGTADMVFTFFNVTTPIT